MLSDDENRLKIKILNLINMNSIKKGISVSKYVN